MTHELPTALRVVIVLYFLFLFVIGIATTYVMLNFHDLQCRLES